VTDRLPEHGTDTYCRLQGAALLELFRRAKGHDCRDTESLELWIVENDGAIASRYGRPIDPYKVLNDDEISRVLATNQGEAPEPQVEL